MAQKFKIKKGDEVIVISGRDKGKKGKILSVLTKKNKVLVEDMGTVKRHQRPSQTSAGGIIDKNSPIHISNVALIDPVSGKPTKVGYRINEDGKKMRIARKSGELIDV